MIVTLLNAPKSAEDWARWSFHHRASHQAIVQALKTQKNVEVPLYILDPIDLSQPKLFLEANQQMHQDMDNALGSQSSDLEDVDVNDARQLQSWIYTHWLEHQAAEAALGISS
ncbi:MAG TPA: hypothetical protein VGN16_09410 [Acidobacteriaceae bacterium]|jgi:hypothetical protein